MKPISLFVSAAGCGLFASCSTPVAMKTGELAGILRESPLATRRVSVSVQVKSPGEKTVTFPTKTVRVGEEFTIRSTREFNYPAKYQLPGVSKNGVEPATPEKLETINTGITLDLKTEAKGPLVLISGKTEVVKFDHFVTMGGEVGKPIADDKGRVISENRIEMPAIRTFMTPVCVAAKPDKPTTFDIDHPTRGSQVTITVKAVN